ncbi:hypothetical protein PHLCEN_2v9538 [Hermanssonia centrifuga]|uniref:Uncharacterized protein n=1 Tax=Hermanssonia centrifuga TaxID=98765 RepID=A0A2R6NQK8_9APHY|nr:hypothetical protein PHLCEN_2v9538 [Hermanssonia centrifuga]
MPYIAGLDVNDILRRSPLSHEQGVESIVFLTTLVSIGGGIRNHLKASSRHRHHGHVTNTGIAAPSGKNIGDKQHVPLSIKILGPLAHGFIFIPPVMYLAGTALGRLQQPDWIYAFSLPSDDLTVGQLATVKTLAAFAHFGVLYLLKHTRKHFRAANLALLVRRNGPLFVHETSYHPPLTP